MENNIKGPDMSLESSYFAGDVNVTIKKLLELKDHFSDGLYFYNLGTLYAKKGDFALARYHLEKSFREGFYSPRMFHNLKYVEEHLNLRQERDHSFYEKLIFKSIEYPPIFFLLLPLVVALLLFIAKKLFKELSVILYFSILSLAFIPLLFIFALNSYFNTGVALNGPAVYDAPSEIYPSRINLLNGEKVLIVRNKNGWSEIIYPSEFSGWVKSKDLGIL